MHGSTLPSGVGPDPLLDRLQVLLDLAPDDLLVQLGSAAPERLLALTERVPLHYQVLVVDPHPERLAPFRCGTRLRLVEMDSLRFAAYPMQCDRILLGDALLRGDAGAELARRLLSRLSPTGRLLAVGEARAQPSQEGRAGDGPLQTLRGAGFAVQGEAARVGDGWVALSLGVKPPSS
jgi:hypothetical protein